MGKKNKHQHGFAPLTQEEQEIVERNIPFIKFYVDRNVYHQYDREEGYDEALLGLMRASKDFNPAKGRFSTYAGLCIYTRLYRKFPKWQQLRMLHSQDFMDDYALSQKTKDYVVSSAWHEERRALVRKALATLPEVEKQLLTRVYFHGISQKDIAAEENVTRQAIHIRLQHALCSLKRAIIRVAPSLHPAMADN